MSGPVACSGVCLTASDVGVDGYPGLIAYPHPQCPEHGEEPMTDLMERPSPRCARCKKTPAEIGYDEYLEPGETADAYVRQEEGTYDPATGAFLCDPCYIRAGQPAKVHPGPRWTATPANLAALGL